MIRIHNVETDEIIDREMTADELKQHNEMAAVAANDKKLAAEHAKNKEALLAKLGITADEATLLLS